MTRIWRGLLPTIAIWMVLSLGIATGALAQDGTPEPDEDSQSAAESELAPELPPPDLPTSNQQGYTFEINSTNSIDLDALPREAVVYEMNWKEPTAARAERVAENLGIEGEVVDRGNDTFDISGEGEIYVAADLVQFYSTDRPEEGELPADDDAIALAREWLRTAGLLPNDADGGRIIARSDEAQRVVVQFLPLEPENLLSAYPSATVTQGPGGVVLEASVRWPNIDRADLYQLRDPKEGWQEIASGQAFIDVNLPEGVADEEGIVQGEAKYSSVEIGYTTGGLPGGTQFLEPVYIFSGRFVPEDSDESFRIKAYVSAVASAGAPVG